MGLQSARCGLEYPPVIDFFLESNLIFMLENSIEISGYRPVEIATVLSLLLWLVQVFNKI